MKTSNALIVGIISSVTILAFVSLSLISSEINLDQIIENKDYKALQKWENDQLLDENLNLSSKQVTELLKLDMECKLKIIKNLYNPDTITENKEFEVQIIIDKYQYKKGDIMKAEIIITPEYNKGISLKFDNYIANMYDIMSADEDGKYRELLTTKLLKEGKHTIGIHKGASPTGFLGEPIEFEIIK